MARIAGEKEEVGEGGWGVEGSGGAKEMKKKNGVNNCEFSQLIFKR